VLWGFFVLGFLGFFVCLFVLFWFFKQKCSIFAIDKDKNSSPEALHIPTSRDGRQPLGAALPTANPTDVP